MFPASICWRESFPSVAKGSRDPVTDVAPSSNLPTRRQQGRPKENILVERVEGCRNYCNRFRSPLRQRQIVLVAVGGGGWVYGVAEEGARRSLLP